MNELNGAGSIGKMLILVGLVLVGIGFLLSTVKSVPWLGRLPGDIHIRRGNVTFYFPLATSIVVSILLTLLARLLSRR